MSSLGLGPRQIQGRLGQQVLGKQSFKPAESSWMPCTVYPCMAQQSLVIGTALAQTFPGKVNQTGLAAAFGKAERPLVCRQRAAWVIKSLPRKILFEHQRSRLWFVCDSLSIRFSNLVPHKESIIWASGLPARPGMGRERFVGQPCYKHPPSSRSLPFVDSSPNSCWGEVSVTRSLGSHKRL